MVRSIKSNFIYNLLNTVTSLLFPLVTFPYASRIIMADGIGQVQFYTSIINYVVLLTGLGIPLYGIREIARVRDNVAELSRTTAEIITLNLLLNLLGYAAIAVMCLTVDEIQTNVPLFLLLSASVVLTTIGCPWFFSGIEDFKYITIRGIIVKTACAAMLFLFVHDKDDLMLYGAYTVVGSIGNNVLNFIRLRKYIRLDSFRFCEINIWRHIRPAFAIFIFNLITSIYVNLDTVMVGFLKDNESVGYYTAATKLSHILLTVVTSLGAVMLPRLSNLVKRGEMDDFYRLAAKAYHFILMLSFPLCAGLIVLAPSLIRLVSGDGFVPAIPTLQIISPIIIAIAISNLIGLQVLYPLGKINIVTISTCIGAAMNFTLNLLLIPRFAQNGAAIATVCAEISVTLTQFIIAGKYIPFKLFNRRMATYFVLSLLMMGLCRSFLSLDCADMVNIIAVPIIGIVVYGGVMLLMRDELTIEMMGFIKRKIIKNK